jgi:hypothetical protein
MTAAEVLAALDIANNMADHLSRIREVDQRMLG